MAQQVRALEDHPGIALFQRLPRRLAFTLRGQSCHAELAQGFDLLARATARLDKRPGRIAT